MTSLVIPPGATGIPVGGVQGQTLAKKSGADYDSIWVPQYLDPMYQWGAIAPVSTQPPAGCFNVDTAVSTGTVLNLMLHENDLLQNRYSQFANLNSGDRIFMQFMDATGATAGGVAWELEAIGSFGFQGTAPNRWAYGQVICRSTVGTPATGQYATMKVIKGQSGVERIIAEVQSTTTSALTATMAVINTVSVTPINQRNYYWLFDRALTISAASAFLYVELHLTNAAGSLYGQFLFVQGNPSAPVSFHGEQPIVLPTGSQINLAICARVNTGTGTLQGAGNNAGLFQIKERV